MQIFFAYVKNLLYLCTRNYRSSLSSEIRKSTLEGCVSSFRVDFQT